MRSFKSQSALALPAAVLLLVVLLFAGACSDEDKDQGANAPPQQKTEVAEKTTSPTTTLETTGDSRPPEVTLGDDGGSPEVTIRLEGDPETTFSGLCSAGAGQEVLSGQVPERFEFDLNGRQLSCRIEKRNDEKGDLKVVLIVGETTRSVQQTSKPDGVIKVNYKG